WSGGRIVLLGDACHPMRPFMAAGGAMAVEDAAILSRCLADAGEPAEAFRRFEATRIPRGAEGQRISIEHTWVRGPTDTGWFYCYDAWTAPLFDPLRAEAPEYARMRAETRSDDRPRSHRLWCIAPASRLAGRRVDRGQHQSQYRGGRRVVAD